MNRTSTAMGDPVLEISGLSKRYGAHLAVDAVDLEVRDGEIFGILGSNGAGKTTTVECAQGLRRPDAGTVRVLGLDPVSSRAELRGRVGSQLQDSNLPDRIRVGEAMKLFAATSAEANRLRDDWDLGSIWTTPFAGLSGGQRQRLFLALALINAPQIVFLDELTQGLDPSARRTVWTLIERVRDTGTTVVIVTHFTEEAEVLCDRVAVMAEGRVIELGTPNALIERHAGSVGVRFAAEPATVDWLRRVDGVEDVRLDGLEVEITGPSSMLAPLGAALVDHGHLPDSIQVAQPDLEDALLNLLSPIGANR